MAWRCPTDAGHSLFTEVRARTMQVLVDREGQELAPMNVVYYDELTEAAVRCVVCHAEAEYEE